MDGSRQGKKAGLFKGPPSTSTLYPQPLLFLFTALLSRQEAASRAQAQAGPGWALGGSCRLRSQPPCASAGFLLGGTLDLALPLLLCSPSFGSLMFVSSEASHYVPVFPKPACSFVKDCYYSLSLECRLTSAGTWLPGNELYLVFPQPPFSKSRALWA